MNLGILDFPYLNVGIRDFEAKLDRDTTTTSFICMTIQVHTELQSCFKKKNQNHIIGQLKSIHARWDVKNSHRDSENVRQFGPG